MVFHQSPEKSRTVRRYVVWALAVGAVLALAVSLWQNGSLDRIVRSQKSYNVIMISIDTLRADHLGLYGYSRDTSPNLDKFAQESLVFEQAIAQAPFTLPSWTSIFTSEYPSTHGLMSVDTSFRLSSS